MASELFERKKCVHINLDKELYVEFRAILYRHGLSAQQVIQELVEHVVKGDHRITNVIEAINVRKAKEELEGIIAKREQKKRDKNKSTVTTRDANILFDLIKKDGNEED